MSKIIQVQNLQKSFQGQKAVQGIDFYVKKGQIFALLGPNGAGKSSVINILCTCTPADSGMVSIDGMTLGQQNPQIQKRIGVVFQNGVLDDLLTVEENLYIRGKFYGLRGSLLQDRISHTAKMTDISHLLHREYGNLSGGQRRRCDIARSLLPLPKILFLDEPTTGLDPEIRTTLWQTLLHIKEKNDMTILLTTHYMEEAARADYIAILNHGKIIASDTPLRLKEKFSQNQLVLFPNQDHVLKSALEQNHISYRFSSNRFIIPITRTLDALPLLRICQGKQSGF